MNAIAPPESPYLVAVDDDGRERLRLRLKQLSWCTVTVAVTAWLCTFGFVAAILAVAVGKHIVVAILLMGVRLNQNPSSA